MTIEEIITGIRTATGQYSIPKEWIADALEKLKDAPENTYLSDLPLTFPVPEDLGGIDAGTLVSALNGKTISAMFDELLFKTIYASMTTPRGVSLNTLNSGILEVGTLISGALVATYNTGEITDGDGTTVNEIGGESTKFEFTHLDGTITDNTNVDTLNVEEEITQGVQKFHVKVTHAGGVKAYKDSKGNTYVDAALDALIAQTVDEKDSATMDGRYWVLIGTFDNAASSEFTNDGTHDILNIALFNEKSLQNNGYQKSVPYVGSRRKCVVTYPATYGNIEKFDFYSLGTGDDKIDDLVETNNVYRKLPNGVYVAYKYYTYTTLAAGNDSDTITIKI